MAGGSLTLVSGARTGERLTFDFSGAPSGGTLAGMVNDFSLLSSETALRLVGTSDGGVYTVAPEGSSELYVYCMPTGLYEGAIKAGERSVNAFLGMAHEFSGDGRSITASAFTVEEYSSAVSLDSAAAIGGDRAAKWTDFSAASGAVLELVSSAFSGDAWLELDGTGLAGTTLYGAAAGTEFSGTVNLLATSGAVLGNLAAGAAAKGSVGGVKLTIDDATLGLAYAGGFGSVEGETETLIGAGSMTKDFYAGALANYAKIHTSTGAGDISLKVESGTFDGNIYGAAAVKAGAATSVVHCVGSVTIDLKDGESTKGAQACLFAGGYATGSSADRVYTVGSVDTTIEGGSWGTVCGGRGVFGGIMASGVEAAVTGDVNITVTGGTMGNVYGGGWAQKGGRSIVGDVNITVTGGTIANIFGGGSHSTSGGSTVAGDVTITVAGGTIANAIYARGQLDGDAAGAAEVVFTGAKNFGCAVYGYSCVGGAAGGAALSFSDYTGTFSGRIGGFDGVTFDGNTTMTLGTAAADADNTAWTFDAKERDIALAGTAFLNWSDADFSGEDSVITLNLAAGDVTAWDLVEAAGATAADFDKFAVRIDGISILNDPIGLGEAIAGGTACDGWGFTLEDGVLKFKNLA